MRVAKQVLVAVSLAAACGAPNGDSSGDDNGVIDAPASSIDAAPDAPPPEPPKVIVIPFENKSTVDIYGNTTDAPYINGLLTTYAYSTNFKDELAQIIPSEPHYVWMEGGTNAFSDRTFVLDSDASSSNSTAETQHLSTQLDAAGISWKSYQEGITAGTCPIASTGHYAAKHNPFVFYKDVSGSPPSASTQRCIDHHATLEAFATDLAADQLPRYSFVTPDLCHDMHGSSSCPSGTNVHANVKAGDDWLAANLPALIDFTKAHNAVVLLVWDEGNTTSLMPFIAIGAHVVPGPNGTLWNHSSQLALSERLLGVPRLATVTSADDMSALFQPGYLP